MPERATAAGTATEDPPAQQVAFLRQAGPQHLQVTCCRICHTPHTYRFRVRTCHSYRAGECAPLCMPHVSSMHALPASLPAITTSAMHSTSTAAWSACPPQSSFSAQVTRMQAVGSRCARAADVVARVPIARGLPGQLTSLSLPRLAHLLSWRRMNDSTRSHANRVMVVTIIDAPPDCYVD